MHGCTCNCNCCWRKKTRRKKNMMERLKRRSLPYSTVRIANATICHIKQPCQPCNLSWAARLALASWSLCHVRKDTRSGSDDSTLVHWWRRNIQSRIFGRLFCGARRVCGLGKQRELHAYAAQNIGRVQLLSRQADTGAEATFKG